jgi:uncharacterized protein (TIGR00725 family)
MKIDRKIYAGVIGERVCPEGLKDTCLKLGRFIALEGWVLLCGGMSGVMENVCKGAVESGGVTIGILPVNLREEGNPYLTYSIPTGLGEARNSILVKSCHIIFAIAGGYGTLSEIAFANLFHIPVIGIHSWEITPEKNRGRKFFTNVTNNPHKAVLMAKEILSLVD